VRRILALARPLLFRTAAPEANRGAKQVQSPDWLSRIGKTNQSTLAGGRQLHFCRGAKEIEMGRKQPSDAGPGDLGGMFRSLGGFMDLLSNLSTLAQENGGEIHRSGEMGEDKKGVKAVYGFSVKVGGAGQPVVEQFGNVKETERGAVVDETREPMVDVFDEEDYLLVVAELPGVDEKDIHFEVEDDVLSLSASRGERKYRKEVLLPSAVKTAGVTPSYRNGVFEIKLPKAA
jgi:HSP20 family protein